MRKDRKSEIHITNNFNAPIGQHIDHVDTINFRMDGDGNFHFGMVNNMNEEKKSDEEDEDETGARIKKALDVLQKEKILKYLYDYTWVMEAMNQTAGMPTFNTPKSFITFLESLGIEKLPSEDSIQLKQNKYTGKFPNWEFTDCDYREATRRINVGKRFLNVYRSK